MQIAFGVESLIFMLEQKEHLKRFFPHKLRRRKPFVWSLELFDVINRYGCLASPVRYFNNKLLDEKMSKGAEIHP